jgi:hypothetical protein
LATQIEHATVAKYHFYIDGELADPSQDGEDFADDDAARVSALRAFGEILRDERILLQSAFFSMRVTDGSGRAIIVLAAQAEMKGSA